MYSMKALSGSAVPCMPGPAADVTQVNYLHSVTPVLSPVINFNFPIVTRILPVELFATVPPHHKELLETIIKMFNVIKSIQQPKIRTR